MGGEGGEVGGVECVVQERFALANVSLLPGRLIAPSSDLNTNQSAGDGSVGSYYDYNGSSV